MESANNLHPKKWYLTSKNPTEYAYARQGISSLEDLENEKNGERGYAEIYKNPNGSWQWMATLLHPDHQRDFSTGNEPSRVEAMKTAEKSIMQMINFRNEFPPNIQNLVGLKSSDRLA